MGECGKGWTGRCSAAKSKRCKCRCGGVNHGAARQKVEDDSPRFTDDTMLCYASDEKRNRSFLPSSAGIERVRFTRVGGAAMVHLHYGEVHGFRRVTELPHLYQRHSPDGFEFGYGGSGPAEAALNLLARFIGPKNATESGLYQEFKWAFVAPMNQTEGGEIYGDAIREWVRGKWAALKESEGWAAQVEKDAAAEEEMREREPSARVQRHRTERAKPGTAERIELAEGEFKL